MADAAAAEFFRVQFQDPANNVCADCGTTEPQWASISHGIYISIEASGIHRSLGVRVSYVQSTSMDSWKPIHLRMMELGGNRRFAEFLREQGVPEDLPIRQKYHTRAAEWYRKNLRAMAEGTELPPPLPGGTGHLPSEGAASPEQRVLDRVFARAPVGGAMTKGGVPTSASSRSRSARGSASATSAAVQRARSTNRGPAKALPKAVGRSNQGSTAADSSALSPSARSSTVSEQLLRLLMSEGDRAAERLRTMSTGKMPGFGPVDCSWCVNQAATASLRPGMQAAMAA
uniref:Arf-GAP domain-containing protein n=1 Tax=Alexandrium catenella TaxID=2925 RepID=A0A7S1MLT8_ALECA|mmetsp:Transcript_29569/g.79867  ORF Transcript_29569/g.79867 Transcript_29569/m.79867 type:complete len:287 (+) Transcript_29569:90-950(+)|eukprot:CAMPEP_0171221820 /NCGR_PEP_ID=MMETSP0790-20130122/34951_1 /TAXON_ID=2925 /ORGANISM="Alexandrium catenella, Strain OF101" /LENGTH=286 /DNA_ID=CAMNT_0011687759 /DNA_START=72 /DNA_END=932 /DNA_ORIENTATION=+